MAYPIEALAQLARIIRSAEINAPSALRHTAYADDGGLLLEVADETTGREILFAIPPDGAKIYFSTSETPSLNGIVTQEILKSLLHWIAVTAHDGRR